MEIHCIFLLDWVVFLVDNYPGISIVQFYCRYKVAYGTVSRYLRKFVNTE